MNSEILEPIAEKLAEIAGGLDTNKGIVWAPKDTGSRPAAVVELPSINRSELDRAEDHLGQDDWTLNYWVVFYFDLSRRPQDAQVKAAAIVEAWIAAVDEQPSLGLDGLVQEAKVVEAAEPEFFDNDSKPVIRWRTRVGVLAFV